MGGLPKRAWAFLAGVVAAAIGASASLAHVYGAPRALFGFAALTLVAEFFPVRRKGASYSVSHIVFVSALITLGPGAAAIAAGLGGLVNLKLHKPKDWLSRVSFNCGQLALTASAAGTVYALVGGPIGHLRASDFPIVLVDRKSVV